MKLIVCFCLCLISITAKAQCKFDEYSGSRTKVKEKSEIVSSRLEWLNKNYKRAICDDEFRKIWLEEARETAKYSRAYRATVKSHLKITSDCSFDAYIAGDDGLAEVVLASLPWLALQQSRLEIDEMNLDSKILEMDVFGSSK